MSWHNPVIDAPPKKYFCAFFHLKGKQIICSFDVLCRSQMCFHTYYLIYILAPWYRPCEQTVHPRVYVTFLPQSLFNPFLYTKRPAKIYDLLCLYPNSYCMKVLYKLMVMIMRLFSRILGFCFIDNLFSIFFQIYSQHSYPT